MAWHYKYITFSNRRKIAALYRANRTLPKVRALRPGWRGGHGSLPGAEPRRKCASARGSSIPTPCTERQWEQMKKDRERCVYIKYYYPGRKCGVHIDGLGWLLEPAVSLSAEMKARRGKSRRAFCVGGLSIFYSSIGSQYASKKRETFQCLITKLMVISKLKCSFIATSSTDLQKVRWRHSHAAQKSVQKFLPGVKQGCLER